VTDKNPIEIRLMGSLEAIGDDGAPIVIRGVRAQALLAALALRRGETVPLDRLVDSVWGDAPPAGAANALQRQISDLRRRFGAGIVEWRGNGYALGLDPSSVDVRRFDDLSGQARRLIAEGDVAGGRALLGEALALRRGEPLPELSDVDWAQPEITRINEAYLAALEARLDADLALGRHAMVVGELEGIVAEQPLREHFWAQLMLALARSGRRAEALRAYQSVRTLLGDELGLDPSDELQRLEAQIVAQDFHAPEGPVGETGRAGTNVPTPLAPLVGRRDELDELTTLVGRSRLVTIVGPGGAGKTRVALELARSFHHDHEIDVWVVELGGVSDPARVGPAVATALQLSEAVDRSTSLARIVRFLHDRHTLLVLDNCEHLVDHVAPVARDLLEACPSLRILATSREPLSITGEVVRPMPPLPIADAITLFRERANAVARSVSPPRGIDDAHAIEELCRQLDGLPLAIELAAARTSTMTVAMLADQINDRFRVLTRGDRSAAPRQQTLRATVDWSYDLLFDDERRVFERLSVFDGGCSLAAARTVCSDSEITPDDVEELLTRLTDKSLVVVRMDRGDVRYDMLQTLHDYGRARLAESGDSARVQHAHMTYFANVCVGATAAQRGEGQRAWLRTMAADGDNVRTALAALLAEDPEKVYEVTGALGWYWWLSGRAIEGSRWLAAARSHSDGASTLARARLLAWSVYLGSADPDREVLEAEVLDELVDRSLQLYRDADALVELAEMGSTLAVMYSTRGHPSRTRQLLVEAQETLATLERTPRVAALHTWLTARRALYEGRPEDAATGIHAALQLLDTVGDEALSAFTQIYLGRLAIMRGDHGSAVAALERGREVAGELGLLGLADLILTDLGDALALDGQLDRARDVLGAADRGGDLIFLPGHGASLVALALLERREGNVNAAVSAATDALALVVASNNRQGIAQCLAILGFLAETAGSLEDALHHHMRAFDYASETNEPRSIALALEGLAGVAAREGDGRRAARLLGAAESLRRATVWRVGWWVASADISDVDRISHAAIAEIGGDAFADAFAHGAANVDAVLNDVRASQP